MIISKKHSTRQSSKAGLPPGTLISISEKSPIKTSVNCIEFDHDSYKEYFDISLKDIQSFKNDGEIRWIEIKGLLDIELIEKIGQVFEIHPLTLEDILNTYIRPKFEEFDNYLFVSLKYIFLKTEVESEHISLIVTENTVISINESDISVFENVKKRIRDSKSKIRGLGSDYLMYMLIDTVVDDYYSALELMGDKIEDIEDIIIDNPNPKVMDSIYSLKRQIIILRKIVWPMRELTSGIRRSNSEIINETTHVYINDVSDHIIQIIDTVETYRDMISGMRDIYLSSLSNRMNEVMKVLTIIATIFIPLTFIAGIYGMNFTYMPELGWDYGYPVTILIMILISIIMLYYFRRKRWI